MTPTTLKQVNIILYYWVSGAQTVAPCVQWRVEVSSLWFLLQCLKWKFSMLLRAKGATCPSSQLVWVSRTFGFSWTNGVPRPVGFIHGLGWAVSMLAGGFTCSIIWQDHQAQGPSADGQRWKNCGLGLTNGRSRSELSAPWILRFDPQIRCVHQPSQVPLY